MAVDPQRTPSAGPAGPSLRVLVASGSAELYGSDRVLLETVRGLVEQGHLVIFVAGSDGPLLAEMDGLGVRSLVQPSPVLRRAYLSPTGLLRFAAVVARTVPGMTGTVLRLRPDVVYVNTTTLPAWSVVARACGRPVVVHVHEAEAGQARPLRRVLATALRAASAVVFNSRTSRDLAVSDAIGGLPPSSVVVNPIAPAGATSAPRESVVGPLRLLYVGRVSERKGVDVALEAVARLARTGRDVTLDVVGDIFPGYEGFLASMRERAARDDLAGRITFHGFQTDVASHREVADIVVVPSRADESFGNVLVEAVSASRPVVAAAQPGLREAAHGLSSVVLVEPGDADALAGGISLVADAWPRYREQARADATVAAARHEPGLYRQDVVDVLLGVLRDRGAGHAEGCRRSP